MAIKQNKLNANDEVVVADDLKMTNGVPNNSDVSTLFTGANTSNNAENVRTSAADATPIATVIAGKITNPSGGSAGNVLKKTADGVEWGTGGGGGTTIQYDSQTGRYYFET